MKYEVSTKPLTDALGIAIVNANISKFYQKSTIAQVSVKDSLLYVNIEASSIVSEVSLKGKCDESGYCKVFVDSALLKQLVSTLDTTTITLEFTDNSLIIHSGKSTFTLPQIIDDADDFELNAPPENIPDGNEMKLDKEDWKFIKDYQMYAISMAFIHPAYARVWVGDSGDVLVGDFDNSLFTHSKRNKLHNTCLLSDTIINMFNILPEGATLIPCGRNYIVKVNTDGFNLISKFTPDYEDDENIGSYNSDIILDMMNSDSDSSMKVDIKTIDKALSQATLLSGNVEDTITFTVNENKINMKDSNVDVNIPFDGKVKDEYSITFKTQTLKSVISNFPEDKITISPMEVDGEISGMVFKCDKLTTVLAGVE